MLPRLFLHGRQPRGPVSLGSPGGAAAGRQPAWPVVILVGLLLSLAVFPKSFSPDPDARHVGIAQSVPTMATYTVILVVSAYILLLRLLYRPRARSLPASALVFGGFLAAGFCLIWEGTP